jgi:hypothetical protein
MKGNTKQTPRKVTQTGECIAVDQMESTTPGFIGQLKGTLTTLRYRYATIYSDHTFIYLQVKLTSEETVKAKVAFEAHAKTYGINVQQYHADNGRFQDTAFKNACKEQGQELSFCGVKAHFQNGRAERKIRDLQDMARTSLSHAIVNNALVNNERNPPRKNYSAVSKPRYHSGNFIHSVVRPMF